MATFCKNYRSSFIYILFSGQNRVFKKLFNDSSFPFQANIPSSLALRLVDMFSLVGREGGRLKSRAGNLASLQNILWLPRCLPGESHDSSFQMEHECLNPMPQKYNDSLLSENI